MTDATVTLAIEIVPSPAMTSQALEEVRELCSEAYAEDFTGYLSDIGPGVHVLGRVGGVLVCHAMWITRWLQPGGRGPLLRSAYVEAVATRPTHQRRGFATRVLARLAEEIRDYDLAALSPSDDGFYARLGWKPWRGPLFIRTTDVELVATPEESVMILPLPRTPADLDPTESLSAEWRRGELW